MLRLDLPDLEFWVGKRLDSAVPPSSVQGRSAQPEPAGSSWIVPTSEQKKYEAENSFVSGTNQEGAKAVSAIFGAKSFNYAKPPSLIKELVHQATGKNDLVMDFFAGSGTTAQAVLELNREDGGNRRFIMVSATEATADDPEKNICRDVCAERIRRVIDGYGATAGTGGDFAYLRTRRIPHEAVLTDIDHAQVWTAVQLIHRQAFAAYDASRQLQESVHTDGGLLYAATLNDAIVSRIVDLAADSPHLTVYTWQPGLLRERLAAQNITIEQIPQFLVSRFGVAS